MGLDVSKRGSIRAGLGEWVVQRVTAVYMLGYIAASLAWILLSPVATHADWVSLSSGLVFKVTILLFVFSMLAHAWLGMKSVMLDYIKPWRLRFMLTMLLAMTLIAVAVWSVLVVGWQ